ncbi:MAG: hypothetical protein E6Q33_03835 [Neisseriales bacterium]|nr:MAG: hypothetical protein E6Q33_03835 [Neisseriales bacterium]
MRKLIALSLTSLTAFSYAGSNTNQPDNEYYAFQQFDNEYNVGYATTSGNLTNGNTGGVNNSQFINLEIEHLFNMGVWFDVSANLLTYYSQSVDPAVSSLGSTTGSQPNFGGINANVGYAFAVIPNHLLLIPYGVIGRNTNLSSYTLNNAGTTTNLTQDYFWTFGVGGRLDYRINDVFDVYLDQSAVYNSSQAPVTQGLAPNDNYLYTTTLGAKFNVWRDLQLGARGFYQNSYYTQSLIGSGASVWVPQSAVGGMVTIGLTY